MFGFLIVKSIYLQLNSFTFLFYILISGTIVSGTEFPFPQPNVNRGMKSPKSRENGGEENPAGGALTNRERSISEPNVNSIIVDRPMPPELSHFRNDRKDIRSKFLFIF